MEKIPEVAKIINESSKIVFITGAGISVSGGIPDFRSHNGLYNEKVGKISGKSMFDAGLFRSVETTKLFYNFMTEIKTTVEKAKVTETHKFLKEMKEDGKLLRVYTQNIDNLDKRAGLKVGDLVDDEVVQLHGELETCVCTNCKYQPDFDDKLVEKFKTYDINCPQCESVNLERKEQGKRARSVGSLRPNIVLYGEYHPKGDVIAELNTKDLKKRPQVLIVMGTSLKIVGLKRLIQSFRNVAKHAIFINLTPCGQEWDDVFDYKLYGESDDICLKLQKQVNQLIKKKEEKASKALARKLKKEREAKVTVDIRTVLKSVKKAVQTETILEKEKIDKNAAKDGTEKLPLSESVSNVLNK